MLGRLLRCFLSDRRSADRFTWLECAAYKAANSFKMPFAIRLALPIPPNRRPYQHRAV